MCSVVGYVGKQQSCSLVLEGLTRLEYRGYDSAGFACFDSRDGNLRCAKAVGQISGLADKLHAFSLDGHVGMGHTRWATHGQATEDNAHPHFDCKQQCAVVHNGIIENYHTLRTALKAEGHIFYSDTDTEVIAHLFEHSLKATHNALLSLKEVVAQLTGAYACVLLSQNDPDSLYLIRKGAPLCLGIGEGEFFVASDPLAFSGKVTKVIFLPNGSFGKITKDSYELFDCDGNPLFIVPQLIDAQWISTGKEGHSHYMLKEIFEQKRAIEKTVHFCELMSDQLETILGISSEEIKAIEKVVFVGCGTSWHAGRIAEFFFESIVGIPATAVLASEFRHRAFFAQENTLFVAISQSGETADTLEAVRLIKETGDVATVALTNSASNTMTRECKGSLVTQAGPEIAVASTKAFSTQIAALYWLANRIAFEKGLLTQEAFAHSTQELLGTAQVLETTIENYRDSINSHDAAFYGNFKHVIFLGRHISYPFALEAALKLQEISYVFAQAYPAGELKHGPLALVDSSTPVFIFSNSDPEIYQKIVANAQEVKARKGHLVVFACQGQTELIALADRAFIFPAIAPLLLPLAMTGVMQFFCYALAKAAGRPIDKPRNLAKSVTVE